MDHRRLGCAGTAWGAVAGAVVGYGVVAVADLLTDVDWRASWTTAGVLVGALSVPALLSWSVRRGRASAPVLHALRRRLWRLREPGSLVAGLGAAYLAVWVAGPGMTQDTVVGFGLVGVLAWPMLAGTVRIMVGRSALRPAWWAASWLFLGAPVCAVLMWVRAGHVTTWPAGVITGVVILVPVAVWRYLRTRRRIRDGDAP